VDYKSSGSSLEIAFDESGNTGGHLLDADQPVLAVASTSVSAVNSARLLAPLTASRGGTRGEVKFNRIRSDRGREALLELLADPVLTPNSVKIAVANKRHMLTFKVVDLVVEPWMNASGYNMYEDGSAKALANMLEQVVGVLGRRQYWDEFLQAFLEASLSADRGAITRCNRALREWAHSAPTMDSEAVLLKGALPEYWREVITGRGPSRYDFDPALPLFVDILREWKKQENPPFSVVHDESKIIAEHAHVLENLHLLPDPARRGHTLSPLGVRPGMLRADGKSGTDPRLQLADVLAGSVRTWTSLAASNAEKDAFSQELFARTSVWVVRSIWSGEDSPD
jgi:hypothetical protein